MFSLSFLTPSLKYSKTTTIFKYPFLNSKIYCSIMLEEDLFFLSNPPSNVKSFLMLCFRVIPFLPSDLRLS